ncbi:MAG TPA: GTP-binding protein, partial [Euryarchaeota archaeon]|nr:GTP-binding protein [Euryarchaeota archaeon]
MSSIKIRVALAGNPNVGKTTLFNRLTGGNLKVGNWPGVTVEKVEGVTRYKGRKMEMVDLPGTYSLTAYSLDELIARNHIIEHTPDVIVQVADAGNLGRNLYLTYQLLELNCKLVIALNMWDMVNDLGLEIDVDALSAHLGVPVVPVVSTTGEGTKELLKVIVEESERGKTCG